MGTRGGYRPGAGRPKGYRAPSTIFANKVKAFLIRRVIRERKPLIEALIAKGKQGDVPALREIFERVLGRETDKLEMIKKVIVLDDQTKVGDKKKEEKNNAIPAA